ncbi:hypothetical protein D3C80_1907550 [compost metagenome]
MAENSRHASIDMWHMLTHGRQSIPHQWAAIIGLHRGDADLAIGKVHHLQGARVFDQLIDVIDNQLLRRDQVVDGHRLWME